MTSVPGWGFALGVAGGFCRAGLLRMSSRVHGFRKEAAGNRQASGEGHFQPRWMASGPADWLLLARRPASDPLKTPGPQAPSGWRVLQAGGSRP